MQKRFIIKAPKPTKDKSNESGYDLFINCCPIAHKAVSPGIKINKARNKLSLSRFLNSNLLKKELMHLQPYLRENLLNQQIMKLNQFDTQNRTLSENMIDLKKSHKKLLFLYPKITS